MKCHDHLKGTRSLFNKCLWVIFGNSGSIMTQHVLFYENPDTCPVSSLGMTQKSGAF